MISTVSLSNASTDKKIVATALTVGTLASCYLFGWLMGKQVERLLTR